MEKKVARKIVVGLLAASVFTIAPMGQTKTAEAGWLGDILGSAIESVSGGKAIKRNSANQMDKILHEAVIANDYDMAVKAIDQGANVNSMYKDNLPLLHALWHIHYKHDNRMADLLIERGADIEGWYDNKNRYMYAFMVDDRDVIKYLIDKGLNINIRGNNNISLLMQVVAIDSWQGKISRYELMQELVNKGVDVNIRASKTGYGYTAGDSALCRAAQTNDIEAAKILLYAGANKNVRNNNGKTPLDLAIEYHHNEMIKFLMNWQ